MKKRSFLWGCLFAGLLIGALLGIGGAWWYFHARRETAEAPPSLLVLAFLLSPSSGDEMKASDLMSVKLQAAAGKTKP